MTDTSNEHECTPCPGGHECPNPCWECLDGERDWYETRIEELERQRQSVLDLCDAAKGEIGMGCWCEGANYGTDHDPGCQGIRTIAWSLDPKAVRDLLKEPT